MPISSTGHSNRVSELLNLNDKKGKVFEIAIQLAAIFAIRGLLRFISTHNIAQFAWYRVVFGLVVVGIANCGSVNGSGG